MVNALAKYQKYAEYKDSGVEWLGKIPSHWASKPLKYLCTYNDDVLSETTSKDSEIQYVDIGSVSAVDGISHIETMVFKDAPSRARRVVKDGDVIVSTVRTYLEAIAPIDNPPENLIVSTGFAVIRPNNELYKGFASYCLRAKGFIKEVVARSVGVSYPAINSSELVNIVIPSLDFKEQTQIANFLDHETAKIDSLIEKQQMLIELLKEKRQAVISHAVTKGLNPDVPMKDSGVEWLGQVPEHWNVSKLKNIIQSLESGCSVNAADVPAQTHELGVLKTSCVYTRSFRIEENKTVVPEDIHRVKCRVRKGAIIISRMNTPELVGASALVKVEADNIYLPDRLWQTIFFKNVEIDAEYLSHFMTIQGFRDQIALGAEGASSSMQNIAKEDYLNINCLVPPLVEQIAVRDFIEDRLMKLDRLNIKAQEAIERLKERRTALISSAVTGKIDVRSWQNPNHNNNEAQMELSQ